MSESLPNQEEAKPERRLSGKEEFLDRLSRTRDLLEQGLSDWSIKKDLAPQFGCSRRTVGRYLTIVRRQIRAEFDPSRIEDHRHDSLAFWRAQYADKKNPPHSRQRAREQADKLMGIYTPTLEVNQNVVPESLKSSIGELIDQRLSPEELAKLAAAMEIIGKLPSSEPDEESEGAE